MQMLSAISSSMKSTGSMLHICPPNDRFIETSVSHAVNENACHIGLQIFKEGPKDTNGMCSNFHNLPNQAQIPECC